MISVKYAVIMAVGAFAAGSFFASPLPEAIAAVIATDVQCTGCVGTPDLAGNAITAAKIKDSEVKAAEIAADSVGGSELIGVTKMLFGQCVVDSTKGTTNVASGSVISIQCNISGVDLDDSTIATVNTGALCFGTRQSTASDNLVTVQVGNECGFTAQLGTGSKISIIVFDK